MKTLMRFLSFGFVALLLLLAAAPLEAQYGAIEGTVRDENGKAMVGALVVIERTDIARGRYEVKTDKKGNYFYMGLPSGPNTRYKVELHREGQVVWQLTDVMVATQEYRRVDIDLAKERARQQAGMTEEQRKQQEEEQKAAEKYKSMEEHYSLGMDYVQQKQYVQAVSQLEAATELDASQYAVWAQLGVAYTGANQIDKAITAYEKALALKPDPEAGIYNNLARLYVRKGRVEDAKQAYEKAAAADPAKATMYYFNMGIELINLGAMKDALEPLRKVVELDPKRAEAHYRIGVCLFSLAESKIEGGVVKTVLQPGTVEAFQKYLELEPKGEFASDAQLYLQAIEAQVPASLGTKKKKK